MPGVNIFKEGVLAMAAAVIIWLICGIASAAIASGKGQSGFAWFFGGLLLGPLGLIIVALLPKIQSEVERRELETGEYKKCPQCAELVKREAKICRFCGYDFTKEEHHEVK